jgi:hypothetical protein
VEPSTTGKEAVEPGVAWRRSSSHKETGEKGQEDKEEWYQNLGIASW